MALPSTHNHNNSQCSVLEVPIDKVKYLEQLSTLSPQSLKLLAELSTYKNIERKLKDNAGLIKIKLAI
jgi:hypothetical protein